MQKSMKQLAEDALAVQNACNLSGVVISWAEAIRQLRELKPDASTEEINRHPVNVLFASKCSDLAGEGYTAYEKAFSWCMECIMERKLEPMPQKPAS